MRTPWALGALPRLLWRLPLLVSLTFAAYLAVLAGLLALGGRTAARRRWRDACFRGWARTAARMLGMRVTARGRPPEAPYLLVTNHLSYVDIVVLAGLLRHAVFVAKAEVRRWPVVGLLCRAAGTLFVERGARGDVLRINREVATRLAGGHGVVLFAEGTSTAGDDVAPFRSPLLEVAARRRLPVCHAALSYRAGADLPPAHLVVCWWGKMAFLGHFLRLLCLPGFEARVRFGAEPLVDADRKRLARRLRRAVRDGFIPVVSFTEE